MNLVGNAITAIVTLLAVVLGAWLSIINQNRLWRRDHSRQWRDIRLNVYNDFLAAYRQYVAFVLEATAIITALPHPRHPGDLMPFFDANGRPYKEKMEAAKTAARLVSESQTTVNALDLLVRNARQVAAARATYAVDEIPAERFDELWKAEDAFIVQIRQELGLPAIDYETQVLSRIDV